MNNYNLIVVGAGPAGLMAAGRAAELGAKVLILEKMMRKGSKLLITGKGRCNLTNNAPVSEFIKHVYPKGRFLRNAFNQFFSEDIIELLQKYGVDITLERGGRYFPTSGKSADVLHGLLEWVHETGAEIQCGQRVEKLHIEDNSIYGLQANGNMFYSDKVILSAGGNAYPATGSDGDGYKLARQAGHKIVPVRPALVPLETEGKKAQKLEGLKLKNVNAIVWVNGKKVKEAFGEMVFMKYGLSGPIILTLSRTVVDELNKGSQVEVTIDLKPALDEQKLDRRLLRELDQNGKKKISNIFPNLLPSAMILVFIEALGIDPDKECHQVSSKERKNIRHLLKNFSFKVTGFRSFKEAIITAGGVPTNEISPKSMESKLVNGLYFAGELIDLDAETGGYNLQIAYSTGWLAGNSCVKI